MRIIMIGQKGLPAHSGGVERHVDELARRLAKQHEVIVYCRKHYTLNANCVQGYDGVHLLYTPTINRKNLDAIVHTFVSSIHALFLKPDIIHYHGIGPALLSWIPRIFAPSAKVIVTFHSQDYHHQKWGVLARTALHVGEFMACKVPHRTIVVSKSLKRYVTEKYGVNAVYIPNGVTMPQRLLPNIIESFGLTRGNYLLSVSRLVKHKGIHYLIDAYNRLTAQELELPKLVIVGSSVFTDRYVADLKTRAQGNPNIIFTGEQQGKALAELYSNAKLFVQPSEGEGLSIALLEAMSFGCPVLVSDIAENKEVLPAIGFTFKNKDVADLANQLRTIVLSPKRAADTSELNRNHVEKNYNFDVLLGQALKLYAQEVVK